MGVNKGRTIPKLEEEKDGDGELCGFRQERTRIGLLTLYLRPELC